MSLQTSQSPRRPALWAGFAVTAGIWLAGYTADAPRWAIAAAALCAAAFLPGIWSRPWRAIWPYLLLLLAAGGHLWLLRHGRPEFDLKYHAASHTPVLLYGRIANEPDIRPNLTLIYLDADSVRYADSTRKRRGGVLMRLDPDIPVQYGEYLVARGILQPISRARNPGEFDYADYLSRRDIYTELTGPDGPAIVGRAQEHELGWTATIVAPLRAWIHARISRHIHGDPAALVMGLMFGERKRLDHRTLLAFQDTGTLHLLAVSGSNVAVVIAVVWASLALFRIPRVARTVITLLALLLFCALSRNQPSVVRASVAGALVLLGHTWHRRIDPLNIWGGSLLLILLAAPAQLFDVGFQLSFAAALGIIVFAPVLARWPAGRCWYHRIARVFVSALGVSIVAQLAVSPILAASFNRIPTVTPLSNLVCVPLAGLATAAGLVTLLLAPLGGIVLSFMSGATWLFAKMLLTSVTFFDRLGMPVAAFASPSPLSILLYYLAVVLIAAVILRPAWWRRVLFGLLIVLNLALWPTVWTGTDDPDIIVLDCGPSAVSVLRWPHSEVWLIDQKTTPRTGHFARVVEPYLRRMGWAQPRLIWLLDGADDLPSIRRLWPAARIVAQPPIPGIVQTRNTGDPNARLRAEVMLDTKQPRLAGICISGQGGTVIWAAPGVPRSLIESSTAESPLCLVAAFPLPSDLTERFGGRPWTLIASSYPARSDKFIPPAPNVQFLSTVTSGGILVSGLTDSLWTESAIR